MRRHFILEGDKTTAGGVVVEGHPSYSFHGRNAAFHGAHIACPACKAVGTLCCIAPRRPYTLPNGQEIGLEQDLCLCKCRKPPQLISSQTFAFMDFSNDEVGPSRGAGSGIDANGEVQTSSAQKEMVDSFDLHFAVRDEVTGKPLPNIPYRLTLANGRQIEGVTDRNGLTEIIAADSAVMAKLEVPYYGNSTSSTDSHDGHCACSR